MRLFITTLIFSILGGQSIAAITPVDLREMAYAGDISGVEAALSDAHQQSLSGDMTYDNLRDLMTVLITTHPDMVDFVKDWAVERPDSPYALTARAFQHYYIGFDIRGEKRGSETHPFARQAFQEMHGFAMDDAIKAQTLAPDFVSASDAVFVLQATTKQLWSWQINRIVGETMSLTPNLGSMRRMTGMSRRAWGGAGYTANVDLCNRHANQLSGADAMSVPVCIVVLMASADQMPENWDLVDEILASEDHKALEFARVSRAVLQARLEDVPLIVAYLEKQTFETPNHSREIWVADSFSRAFSIPPQGRALLDDFQTRLHDGVRKQLPHDPFRVQLLKVATYDYPRFTGRTIAATDELQMYRHRLTAAQPFDPDRWFSLRNGVSRSLEPDRIATLDGPYTNAIYYSGHDIQYVEKFMFDQVFKYEAYYIDANWTGHAGTLPIAPKRVFREVIACRALRLMRVFEAITVVDPDYMEYGRDKLASERVRVVRDHIRANQDCDDVWNAPIETLWFEPVAVDLEPLLSLPAQDG